MSKEAMKLALEALEAMQSYAAAERKGLRICDEAITALREALAEQPAPVQQEPDWLTGKQRIYLAQAWAMLDDYALDQRSKGNDSFANGAEASSHEIKVMLSTPQPAQRKPLTDEQIIASNYPDGEENGPTIAAPDFELICFARQIEAAHGIKENT